MDKDNYRITVCPSCQCRYRTPEAFIGRKVSCKKCGTGFKLDFQDENEQKQGRQDASFGQEEVEKISQDDVCLVIGKLAVKYEFVSVEQVKEALSIKEQEKRAGKKVYLGEIMVNHGMISHTQLDFLISVQKMFETRRLDSRFGTIAVKNDFATRDEIDRAFQEQNRIFKKTKILKLIGDILVESNVLTEEERDAILLRQKRFDEITSAEKKRHSANDSEEQIKSDVEFDLTVSEDKLSAFISINGENTDPIAIEKIKSFLQMKGIEYGIVDDAQIAACLKNNGNQKKPLKIAEGKPPEPGKNADIKYYFDTDSLKVGTIKGGGAIDFKDRGDIPQVKEGGLLAEKIPVAEGMPGKDVYGCSITAPKPKDTKLRPGKGTAISDDRLKIFAKIDGIPEISAIGKVYISPELNISGDVGLETGHVNFDGKIHVAGAIQSGYRVQGNSLTAKEILKAEIEMTGDIVVHGGIMGATIKTDGNIRAVYIHESHIEAFGGIVVEKEIMESKIDTGGAFIVNSGPILSSAVAAKKGIRAINIGSEVSKPCNLIVGLDERIKNETDQIKEVIPQKIEEKKVLKSRLEELVEMPEKIEKEIGIMVQIQDKGMVKRRNIQKKIEELKKKGNKDLLADVEKELKELDSGMKAEEEKIEQLFDKQDQITDEISDIQKKITDSEAEIKEMKDKIAEIIEWSTKEKGIPEVRVSDTIFADTTINGMYSSMTLKKSRKNVLIKEEVFQGADDSLNVGTGEEKYGYKISIIPQ